MLGLILVTCLVVIYSRKPVGETVSPVTSTESSRVASRPPASAPVAANDRAAREITNTDTASEKSNDEIPTVESSWSNELRELKELAAHDADAALARVAAMHEKHERKTVVQSVCLIIANKDPAKAMLAAWKNDLGKYADEAAENITVETLAKQWAEADLVKAFVWASTLPADDEARRDRVVKGIALALAQVAPVEAATMIAKHIHPESAVHADAAIEVLRTWAAQEYSGAMAWASLFPTGALRERSLEELANASPGQAPSDTPN